jgi:Xaa-Pro dipeptidase
VTHVAGTNIREGPAVGEQILSKMRDAMAERGLDALVPMSPENVAYAAGAAPPSQKTVRSRLAACIVPAEGSTEAVVIALEAPLMRSQSRLDSVTAYQEFEHDPIEVMAQSLRTKGLADARVGIEETYLSVVAYRTLKKALPDAHLEAADDLLSELRTIKAPAEIDMIRDIGGAAQRIAEECAGLVRAGSTERELANLISERYAAAGGDGLTMLVVGSGPRSAHPNAPATDRVLEQGDIVRLDIIGTKSNYYSDVARTAVVGEPTSEQRQVYDLLFSVHQRSLEALKPGVPSSDVYRIYRGAMEEAGLPPYHFVGHGLGVTLHEDPFVNDRKSVPLEENMVLCIEPLTMLEGRFGLQIEDEVIITADGYEPITRAGDMLRIEP